MDKSGFGKMHEGLKDILSFLKIVVTNWVFVLLLALDGIAILVQFFWPSLRLPTVTYPIIALLGFAWAVFKAYADLLSRLRAAMNTRADILPNPHLAFH